MKERATYSLSHFPKTEASPKGDIHCLHAHLSSHSYWPHEAEQPSSKEVLEFNLQTHRKYSVRQANLVRLSTVKDLFANQ